MPTHGEDSEVNEGFRNFLSNDLGVNADFFSLVRKDDDWSCFVKLHALLEASLNHLLLKHFQDDRLAKIISFLETGDNRKGKIAFISALELLPVEMRGFIRRFSELRNQFAHGVKNTKFRLATWIEQECTFKENLYKAMAEVLGSEQIATPNGPFSATDLVRSDPRLMLTMATTLVCLTIWGGYKQALKVEDLLQLKLGSRTEPQSKLRRLPRKV